jgi:hypothetical protein
MNNLHLIFLLFIVKLVLGLKLNDCYYINFLILYAYVYSKTKSHSVSASIGFINLFISTFFRYTLDDSKSYVVNSLIYSYIVLNLDSIINIITPYIKQIIFCSTSYIFFSIFEWIIHKYIMHCNKQSLYYYLLNFIDHNGVIEETCDHHIEHHKEVKPNMTLSQVKHKTSLFMGWRVSIYIIVFTFISMVISMFTSKITLSYTTLLISSIVITMIWSYLWNKVHPLMHQYNGSYTLEEGPYESRLNFNLVNKLFFRNHQFHHLQKGTKKGNYNIIVFGADEWFGTNVKHINNKKYCSNPDVSHEEICKI